MSKCMNRAAMVAAIFGLLLSGATMAFAQRSPSSSASAIGNAYVSPPPPDANLQAPETTGTIQLQSVPITPQTAPDSSVPTHDTGQFEHHDSPLSFPEIPDEAVVAHPCGAA